jgi:hypothetical protein
MEARANPGVISYMGLGVLTETRLRVISGDTPQQNSIPQTLTA